MDEIITGEQPETCDANAAQVANYDCANSEAGSPFGKFKDAESLLNAYNNLQAEFTKKCQRLSEIEKNNVTIFEESNWQEKVADFLSTHKDAQNYSAEISDLILSDPSLSKEDKALEIAYGKIIAEKYKSPEALARDDSFLENYVMKNDDVKNKIIIDYLKTVKTAPKVISGDLGRRASIGTMENPSSLDEAKNIVKNMFL